MALFDKPLFMFDMANNHQGSVEHGLNIIRALRSACEPYMKEFNIAVKFQYRDLDTFIHPDYRESDLKNVKRFRETRLNAEDFATLRSEAKSLGFYAICTPFDEPSVQLIIQHGYDAIKIASASFTDWSLLTRVANENKPVIASCAASAFDDIWRVVMFFKNRKIDLTLMHCVAEYPTKNEQLQLNQIDLFRHKFPDLRVGYSTHEKPDNLDSVKIAVAKGATVFEKHIGLPAANITLNDYSLTPAQAAAWLESAKEAYDICGVAGARYEPTKKELDDINALKRGVFTKTTINTGDTVNTENTFFAFPGTQGQLSVSNMSKYAEIKVIHPIVGNAPIMLDDVHIIDRFNIVNDIIDDVVCLLRKSGIVVPIDSVCELSHHYGIDKFHEVGVTIITCVNREYCKKVLVILPGQSNPEHTHVRKEETFTIIYGALTLVCNGETKTLKTGETITIERGSAHSFHSETGCVFEEISTTHNANDSFYTDNDGFANPRKTDVYLTKDVFIRAGEV